MSGESMIHMAIFLSFKILYTSSENHDLSLNSTVHLKSSLKKPMREMSAISSLLYPFGN